MRAIVAIAVLGTIGTLAWTSQASASKVAIEEIPLGPRAAARGVGTEVLVFRAGKSEANRVQVSTSGFRTTLTDRGAVLQAGKGCDRLTKHKAVCKFEQLRRLVFSQIGRAYLKGGRDVFRGGEGMFWNLVNAGSGNDRVRTGTGNARINGGTGSDVISARGDNDFAVYAGRKDDLRIKLAGAGRNDGGPRDGKVGRRDRLVGIENATGGRGDDVLRGNGKRNFFSPMQGQDKVFSLGGDDFIELGVDPFGGGDPDGDQDVVDCGAGAADEIQGEDAFDQNPNCEG